MDIKILTQNIVNSPGDFTAEQIEKYFEEYAELRLFKVISSLPTVEEIEANAKEKSKMEPTGAEEFGRMWGAMWMRSQIKKKLTCKHDEQMFDDNIIQPSKKYSNISESVQRSIDSVNQLLNPVYVAYREQIKGLTREESGLIALEYIEQLHSYLYQGRIDERIRIHSEKELKRKRNNK